MMYWKNKHTIILDSKQRDFGTTTNYTINFTGNMQINGTADIILQYVQIPSTYYNIQTPISMDINDGLGTFLDIPAGNYTRASLITQINTDLQIADPNYLASYNSNTMRVTIENTTPINFDLDFATFSNLARRLGFVETLLTGVDTYLGTLVPQLLNRHCFVNISGLSSTNLDPLGKLQYFVPMAEVRDEVNVYSHFSFYTQDASVRQIGGMNVRIYDENAQPLELHGGDVTIILTIKK